MGPKEENEGEERNCWADPMDWEAFEVQEVLALLAGWETICHQDPDIRRWEELLVLRKEAAQVC